MSETFIQYLEKWLKQSTVQGLNNPLVKMPVKRFRLLQADEFDSIANGGTLLIGTTSDPIARNLYKNYQTRIRERGEHCSFICCGAVEMIIAGDGQQQRTALFPVCLKRASLETSGDKIKVTVSDEETWQFNPVLQAHLRAFGISGVASFYRTPEVAIGWVKAQLGNRASSISSDSYIGLFSSQQMVLQQRLTEPYLRQALAQNPVIQAKIGGSQVTSPVLSETTDEGLEELGLVLPCDDHQLRVVQLSDRRFNLQVEGPPGTGKSQTIANIISNAMYKGLKVLLVCDKRAAIVQVEERLADCGLKPALLNLHDEGLDKHEFLKQATDKFPQDGPIALPIFPFELLGETRKTLNERIIFGRTIAHPSLQVTNRQALAGLIQLRKELVDVPKIPITNWQSLSKERLAKLLSSVAEWPELVEIVADSKNVWNKVKPEAFAQNSNADRELPSKIQKVISRIESLDEDREMAASVGIELPLESDQNVAAILELVRCVLEKPDCYPRIVGNSQISLKELGHLQLEWWKLQRLLAAHYPVVLSESCSAETVKEAKDLLSNEAAISWQDLSHRVVYKENCLAKYKESQDKYLRFCDQIGLVYSPLLKVRRAQYQAVLGLGKFGGLIPHSWWNASYNPVLMVDGWVSKLKACISHEKAAPLPLHLVALERITITHWTHVEAMAEHGFNLVSYCISFVNDRKCKYALQQAYPDIPVRGFKQWREVTLHAVAAQGMVKSLRESAEIHVILKHLTENYLAIAHEAGDKANEFVEYGDVKRLIDAAALVEQWRERNDLFEVNSIHWQTFWESPNPNVLQQVEFALAELDMLELPDKRSDNLEDALKVIEQARRRIQDFLKANERQDGDRSQSVMASLAAQKEFDRCQKNLAPITKYLTLQTEGQSEPDWEWLQKVLAWRDLFERLCGKQKLDMDSPLWLKLRDRLQDYKTFIQQNCNELGAFFEDFPLTIVNYVSFKDFLNQIIADLPRHPLWLEKKRWQKKIAAFPELTTLWSKIIEGTVQPDCAKRLFCFNLLKMCEPFAQPIGPELRQKLHSFEEQDERLSSWIVDQLKARLRHSMQNAASAAAASEAALRHLSGLKRIHGTIRDIIKPHIDYLLAVKPCWMMSPTSLTNLIDERAFDHGIPFDLVIFDEASQIRILDGLLSMAFGKQVIIVGDKNQLPPTDFFSSFANPDTDAESDDFGTSESLLEEFMGVFEEGKTHVMLMSHYRSETPDLIRFSNDWFYDGKLEMYPPAHISGMGRRLQYVPNAIYSETAGLRNNPVEAREVVKLIELHVHDYPGKSLGVVTMNIPQMELIDELLHFFVPQNVQDFCADERKFFLRNLETVQGDEMDRIILSLTYGKNPSGQFNAAILGPITKSGGERRLNVAITRSRSGMVIVSSLSAADLATSGAQSNGFKCLKAFLTDLESSQQIRNFGIDSKRFEKKMDGISNLVFCESPFEEQVVEFLENQGFELECQYGDGNFRLDIVVKENGRNLLAIECDGTSYHNSLVARTRDRARQRILQSRGWHVHHVWSTNWWSWEQAEKQSILDAINVAHNGQRK